MDERIKIEIELVVTQEDIDDIMCGALEGGINYWCDEVSVVGDYLGEYASEQIARGGKLRLWDYEDESERFLDRDMILKGIMMYAKNPTGCNCIIQIDGKLQIDCCNADADVCDSIVQYALFDEVIYG